ncbi:ABC transporter substrate-binding protein [Modestobacter sp. I12A-02662]|uniref:ABC transporter substrate-binding protein n=1 Tax=Modestobacter sp. I12A-02662 TaxID=1730496 RepID=UPI0034DE26C5
MLSLTACGSSSGAAEEPAAAAQEETRTVTHALGTTEIVGEPERVVVLDTGELDAVVALGITPVGAVRTDVSAELPGYLEDAGADPAEIAEVGTINEPDLERIAALEPDLILSNAVRHREIYDQLSAIAPTVLAEDVGDTWKENLLLDAEALGLTAEAEQLLSDLEARAVEVGAQFGDPAALEVSVVRFVGAGSVRLYGEGSFIGTVLADAGFSRPEVQRTPETFVEVGPEEISQADGDLLFSAAYGEDGQADLSGLTTGGLWQSLPVVQQGRAYPVDDDRWFLAIGPLGAGLVLDDLEEIAGRQPS